jgi:plasmid stability protein
MTLTLPDIPLELDAALRRRAAEQHRPVDQVAVDALRAGLGLPDHASRGGTKTHLAASVRARFAPLGGVELPEPVREPMREPLDFRE